jgi:hypothetical protein
MQFRDDQELKDHRRVPTCIIQEPTPAEGFDEVIANKLRCRKKDHPNQSEEDRWAQIYQLLFPGEEVPSPCEFFILAFLYLFLSYWRIIDASKVCPYHPFSIISTTQYLSNLQTLSQFSRMPLLPLSSQDTSNTRDKKYLVYSDENWKLLRRRKM